MSAIKKLKHKILALMETGRGSAEIALHPVPLEPQFRPLSYRRESTTILQRLINTDEQPYPVEKVDNRAVPSCSYSFIRIKPSSSDKAPIETIVQILGTLKSSSPISFEIIKTNKEIYFQIAIPAYLERTALSLLWSAFPSCDFIVTKDALLPANFEARAYRLRDSHFFPLKINGDDKRDPYRVLCGLMSSLEDNESAVFQVLFSPVTCDWADNMRNASRNPHDPPQSVFVDLPINKIVEQKIAKPLFSVSIRLAAPNKLLLDSIEGFFNQFQSNDNGIVPVTGTYPTESLILRTTHVCGTILNLSELGWFVHMPTTDLISAVPNLVLAKKTYEAPEEYTKGDIILGTNRHRGVDKIVRLSRNLNNSHLFASGPSGVGKTNFFFWLIIQMIRHNMGLTVIDIVGSMINTILRHIPKHRIRDVILFRPGNFEEIISLNPLENTGSQIEKDHIRSDLLDFFESLFEGPFGVSIRHVLSFAFTTLLTRKDSTLYDLESLLIDREWRKHFLLTVSDQRILAFWELEFVGLEKKGIVTAILNKLSPMMLPDSIIGPMLMGRSNKIDFGKIMDDRLIFLVDLGSNSMAFRDALLIAQFILLRIRVSATMRRPDGTNPEHTIFADEAQYLGNILAEILRSLRKFNVSLYFCAQAMDDFTEEIRRHIFDCSTSVFFSTDNQADQNAIVKNLLHRFEACDIASQEKGHCLVRMGNSCFNVAIPKIPNPPESNYAEEIIRASKEKYTSSKASLLAEAKAVYSTAVAESKKVAIKDYPKSQELSLLLTHQEKQFLECVFHNPASNITSLYKLNNVGCSLGDRIKRSLISKQLLRDVKTSGPKTAKVLILTPKGFDVLGHDLVPSEGKGGIAHKYWQAFIKSHAEGLGYSAKIEELIPGSTESVDVGLHRNGQSIAVEISVMTRAAQEINNIAKCLKAGYDRVISLHQDEDKVAEVRRITATVLTVEDLNKLTVGLIYEFCEFC